MSYDMIRRDALLEFARNHIDGKIDCNDIARFPYANAEPVRHGRYGFIGAEFMAGPSPFYYGTCSECRERIKFDPKHRNYCPNCGAKMDGDADVPKN